MEIKKYIISGNQLSKLVTMLKKLPDVSDYYTTSYGKCHLFASDEYYLRINSNLLITFIISERNEHEYDLEFIVGGGANGLVAMDLGSESSALDKTLKMIQNLAKENNWDIKENS